jgi:hypothetical protein
MRQRLTTFISGMIVGAAILAASGYMAGFERPVHRALPQVSVAQPQPIWEEYLALERRIPNDLQGCVAREAEAASQREMARHSRALTFGLEKALNTCVSMQKPPKTFAQK